jgi:DNA-directed RNA polymerase subunit RPC12/RpoP
LYSLANLRWPGAAAEWKTASFAEAIKMVYESEGAPLVALRPSIIDVASKNAKDLYTKDYGARFREVAGEVAAFTTTLAARIITGPGSTDTTTSPKGFKTYQCSHCGRQFQTAPIAFSFSTRHWCPHCGYSQLDCTWANGVVS